MKIVTTLMVFVVTAAALGTELPAGTPEMQSEGLNWRDDELLVIDKPALPVWLQLREMTYAERQNAIIDIELFGDALDQASALGERIENLWNGGRFDEALRLFDELGRLIDFRQVAIGISWRRPIETTDLPTWGTDIRIGTRDSVLEAFLDIHRASGNLFVLLLYQVGSNYSWSMNFSTNAGNTWSETYTWNSSTPIPDLGVSVVGNNCFVNYFSYVSPFDARLRKFSTATGLAEDFSGGQSYLTVFSTSSPDTLRELELTSDQDFSNNRLYYLANSRSGALRGYWAAPPYESWTMLSSFPASNVERGLDACTNEGYDSRYMWISYYDTSDTLRIVSRSAYTGWEILWKYRAHSGSRYSSIGAWHDTITCFFEYYGANKQCRYLVTYDGGSSFHWGFIGDTTVTAETPMTTSRDGGGVATVFRHYTSPRQGRYTRRMYTGIWSTPVQYTDYEPHWYPGAIEYLGGGTYGVVYITNTSPATRAAMFDRHGGTDITESPAKPDKYLLIENYPNPFNASTIIRYNLPEAANVQIDIYDMLGRKVANLNRGWQVAGTHSLAWDGTGFASGIYLCRLTAGENSQVQKMLLVK